MLCHYVTPSVTHMASSTGETFEMTSEITCTSKNVIYDLWCDNCRNSATPNPGSDLYVGKTSGEAAARFSKHKSDVNLKKNTAVSDHFNSPGHSSSDMRFLPFEIVAGDATLLASREEFWIKRKQTFHTGINRQK